MLSVLRVVIFFVSLYSNRTVTNTSDSSSLSSPLSPSLTCGNMSVYRVFLHVCMCKSLFAVIHMWKSEDKF